MTSLGKIQDGVVVFEGDQKPEDGSVVRVEPMSTSHDDKADNDGDSIEEQLLKLAGIIEDGPEDGSINHDHYLYGLPKK